VAGHVAGSTAEGAAPKTALISGQILIGKDFDIYYSEPATHRIRKIDVFNGVLTVIGTGSPGYGADYSPAASSPLNAPWGFVKASNSMFIGDVGNNAIR